MIIEYIFGNVISNTHICISTSITFTTKDTLTPDSVLCKNVGHF